MSEQCPKCGAKRLSRPYVSAYDPADEWSCGTSRGHFSGVAEGNACLKNQLAARDAELAEARAEIERLRGVISVIYARAKSQPTHICEVADFDLSIIADECSAALAPAPPKREERPVRPVLPSNEPWDNGFQGWPPNWPLYKQACFRNWDDCCDMLVGFCKCGASHGPGEFEYKGGVLYRYGTPVDSIDPAAVALWKREREGGGT